MTPLSLTNDRRGSCELDHELTLNRAGGATHLRLLPSGDGWSLVGDHGELVFSALGVSGRRRCLEFARARGVAALIS
jgi:hypothetical protein